MRDFVEVVRAALKALNVIRAEYVVIGGLASIHYGRPRTTTDVDIIINFEKSDYMKVADSFKEQGFDVTSTEIRRALSEQTHFTVFDEKAPYRLDIKGVHTPLDEASYRRRMRTTIFGEEAWIETPEDLIVAKLVYGSPQDLEDALAALIRQKSKLDIDYLAQHAKKNKVGSKLRKLLESAREKTT